MKFGRAPATLMILSIFQFLFPLLWERVRVRDLVRLNGALPFARLSLARNLFSENFLRWASPPPPHPGPLPEGEGGTRPRPAIPCATIHESGRSRAWSLLNPRVRSAPICRCA